jgi:hypothetical protein
MNTTKRKAPYRHSDGSGCWTKNCSRGHVSAGKVQASMDRLNQLLATMPASQKPAPTTVVEVDRSYQIGHQPNETGSFAYNLSNGGDFVPEDVYEHPEWYFSMNEQPERESFAVLKSIKGNPDAMVTIYRGVPNFVSTINEGDWVTLSPSYASVHAAGNIGTDSQENKTKVIKMQVPAKEIRWSGDSLNEFGWFPNNVDGPVEL